MCYDFMEHYYGNEHTEGLSPQSGFISLSSEQLPDTDEILFAEKLQLTYCSTFNESSWGEGFYFINSSQNRVVIILIDMQRRKCAHTGRVSS